jgi:hypothetical protein
MMLGVGRHTVPQALTKTDGQVRAGAGRTWWVCGSWVRELGWLVVVVAIRTAVIEPANEEGKRRSRWRDVYGVGPASSAFPGHGRVDRRDGRGVRHHAVTCF